MLEKFPQFTEEMFHTLRQYVKAPLFMFNDTEVIYLTTSANIWKEEETALKEQFKKLVLTEPQPLSLSWKSKELVSITMQAKPVVYLGQLYLIGELELLKDDIREMKRVSYTMELMLEVAQKILNLNGEEDIFAFILENAKKAVKKSRYCTIMLVEGNKTKIVAQSGYNEKVYDINIPVNSTFLYMETEGKMDRIANVPDLSVYAENYIDNKSIDGEVTLLKSTMAAPLYVNNRLFAMINFDDVEINAFDKEDEELLNLMKKHIEIALSNYFMYHKIEQYANYDQLTQLHNRIYLETHFDLIDKEDLYLVVMDLNDLKYVNDNYGHTYGDTLICKYARALKAMRSESELAVRNGGDEFVALLRGDSLEAVVERLEALQRKLNADLIDADGENIKVSFSYGVVAYNSNAQLYELLREADVLMYKYKRQYKRKK